MKNKLFTVLVLLLFCASSKAAVVDIEKEIEALVRSRVPVPSPDDIPIIYELVHENLRPDSDEFYVNSIVQIKDKAKATIARSQNQRAGELYQTYVSYGVGDYIGPDLLIKAIDTKRKEVIVYDEKKQDYYGLLLSYGRATSRLVKVSGYRD